MARWLKTAGMGKQSLVLDLGCGKGAVAVEVARTAGCRVVGVDAFEPFLVRARELAERRGVSSLCDFQLGIAQQRRGRRYDAVILLNVVPFEQAIPLARRLTKPDGYYLVDDAVHVKRDDDVFPTARDVADAIEDVDDRVVRAKVWTRAEVRSRERSNYELLRKNAAALARKNPRDRELLSECLRRQRAGIEDLTGDIRPACWLVRRGKR